jgi:hypothetical protein
MLHGMRSPPIAEEQVQGFWGQGRCSWDAYCASPGCVCGDEHPSADYPVGDLETP